FSIVLQYPVPSWRNSPGDRKRVQAEEEAPVVLVRHVGEVDREPQVRYSPEQRLEHDLQFHPGQELAEALVWTVPESDVVADIPIEVQLVRVVEDRLVPIRGGQAHDNGLVSADQHAGQ